MRLGDFILVNMERILGEWELFAVTIVPSALGMDSSSLRNHAKLMLQAIALDLSQGQSEEQQQRKSFGMGRLIPSESSAETHAASRLLSGFSIDQLLSEYRALRASVLRMWAKEEQSSTTDIHDMTRFNEAIDQAIAESIARYSEISSRAQHLFLAILGHDLKNPLSTTLMAAHFICETKDLDHHVEAAKRIHTAGTRMSKLVNDLIDYTRIHLGSSLPVNPKLTSLESICRDVLAEHEMAHPKWKFELCVDGVSEGVWDDNRMAQVLSNLLGNAVQYGDDAEPIVIRLCAQANHIILSVTNKGEIIPAEKIGTLFYPLVRLIDDKQSNSLGIGLYIAREIIRAHGGSITVSSSKESGTIFTAILPR